MTSQSPRIYTYKITFEEVPYYYYGVHKEKKFGERYWGSPKKNKWCWNFYTPKKQILQLFDFTDEGWIEAQEVEKRLIKPFYDTDKWCLNENCGGIISLDVLRESGNRCYELGLGFHSLSKDKRIEISRKIGIENYKNGVGIHTQTFEDRREFGKNLHKNKKGVHSLSKEERLIYSRNGGQKTYELGLGIFGLSPEQVVENAKKATQRARELGVGVYGITKEKRSEIIKKVNAQKWKCTETGYTANPGALSTYQKKRGIDTSKRIRLK